MLMQKKTDSPEIRNQRGPACASWTHRKMLDSLTVPSCTSELESQDMRLPIECATHELGCIRLYGARVGSLVLLVGPCVSCHTMRGWRWGKAEKCPNAGHHCAGQ